MTLDSVIVAVFLFALFKMIAYLKKDNDELVRRYNDTQTFNQIMIAEFGETNDFSLPEDS